MNCRCRINELEIKVNKIRKDISLLNGRKPIPKFSLKKSYFGAENLKNSVNWIERIK